MPYAAVTLRPGVDIQRTFSLNETGVSQAQLLRYKEGLIETYGGWTQYVPFNTPSTVRDLHAWQDAAGGKHLGIGATNNLAVVTSGSNQDITPQTATTNPTPNFSVSSGSNVVTIVDAGSSGIPSVYNSVFFNTPVAIGNLLLNGGYHIASVLSSISYTIVSSVISSTTIVSSGTLPAFTTTANSAQISVSLANHNFLSIPGLFYSFYAPTTVDGLIVEGPYEIQSVVSSTNFLINATETASAAATATMNSSFAQIVYYITPGPQAAGSGWGAGAWGSGGWGTGTAFAGATGTPITVDDWTLDNWGEVLIACVKDGPIYTWSANSGFAIASVIDEAPFFNGGAFVSMPQQILVAWRSGQEITGTQDNLLVRWSDSEDFTTWEVSNQTAAGSFKIPTGSLITGGLQAANQGIIWTDVDCWVMRYIGGDLIFNFTRVGSGCGLVGPHAAGTLGGIVWWMSTNNFFILGPQGVEPLPCTVWDFVFQNINTNYINKVQCATNSAFNEVKWFFPSTGATENDSFVKYNIIEKEWDYGKLARTAWTDVSVLGNPIGTGPGGMIYQHETGNATTGVSVPSFTSGWWTITEGNDFAFVDFVIPDFHFGKYPGPDNARIEVTFLAADYPGDTPRSYGPYVVTNATEYLTPRLRGRLMAVQVTGDGLTWWRLGKVRYRWAHAGRR